MSFGKQWFESAGFKDFYLFRRSNEFSYRLLGNDTVVKSVTYAVGHFSEDEEESKAKAAQALAKKIRGIKSQADTLQLSVVVTAPPKFIVNDDEVVKKVTACIALFVLPETAAVHGEIIHTPLEE